MSVETKVSNFVAKRLEMVGDAECKRLALMHEIQDAKPRMLLNCIVDHSKIESEKERISDEIMASAHSHAEESTRLQRYSVVAYAADETVLAMCPFRMRPTTESSAGTDFDSEPATPNGLISQMMRHNEALTRMHLANYKDMMGLLAEEVGRVRRRNDELEDKNISMVRMYEELMSEKHQRDMETLKEAHSEDRKERLLTQGEKLLPFIAAKVTGQTAVKKFMQTLAPDDMAKLMTILRPEQIEALEGILDEGNAIKSLGGDSEGDENAD